MESAQETYISCELAILEQKEKNFKALFLEGTPEAAFRDKIGAAPFATRGHLPSDVRMPRWQEIKDTQEECCRRAATLTQDGRYYAIKTEDDGPRVPGGGAHPRESAHTGQAELSRAAPWARTSGQPSAGLSTSPVQKEGSAPPGGLGPGSSACERPRATAPSSQPLLCVRREGWWGGEAGGSSDIPVNYGESSQDPASGCENKRGPQRGRASRRVQRRKACSTSLHRRTRLSCNLGGRAPGPEAPQRNDDHVYRPGLLGKAVRLEPGSQASG